MVVDTIYPFYNVYNIFTFIQLNNIVIHSIMLQTHVFSASIIPMTRIRERLKFTRYLSEDHADAYQHFVASHLEGFALLVFSHGLSSPFVFPPPSFSVTCGLVLLV